MFCIPVFGSYLFYFTLTISKRENSEEFNEEKTNFENKIISKHKNSKDIFFKIDKVKSALRTIIKNKTRKLNMNFAFGSSIRKHYG